LLLLVQAGASATRPVPAPSPTGTTCAKPFTIGFVADVAGLRSSVDAAGWRGVGQALREISCSHADLALPARPSEYPAMLQAFAGHDLVIAGSFLLTDPVIDVARANPATRFVLVDPLVTPPDVRNLAVLMFRSDQAAFLAGALAGIVTRTGVVAGVYGPEGMIDKQNRLGFEHGAQYVRADVRVLGAYQPPQEGQPYGNPSWGAKQALTFINQQADVIFGAGGTTGEGALLGDAHAGRFCISTVIDRADGAARAPCLIGAIVERVDAALKSAVLGAAAGRWTGGVLALGIADGAVGLSLLSDPRLTPEIRGRLHVISDLLAAGSLSTGV
jgi:basic membrane protein A and related proteins